MTITFAEARHRLQTIVESQGDVVRGGEYVTCSYFNHDGTPQCLVGEAFAAELTQAGVQFGSESNKYGVTELSDEGLIEIEELAVTYLDAAQSQQDLGANWAAAVMYAETVVHDQLGSQLIAA